MPGVPSPTPLLVVRDEGVSGSSPLQTTEPLSSLVVPVPTITLSASIGLLNADVMLHSSDVSASSSRSMFGGAEDYMELLVHGSGGESRQLRVSPYSPELEPSSCVDARSSPAAGGASRPSTWRRMSLRFASDTGEHVEGSTVFDLGEFVLLDVSCHSELLLSSIADVIEKETLEEVARQKKQANGSTSSKSDGNHSMSGNTSGNVGENSFIERLKIDSSGRAAGATPLILTNSPKTFALKVRARMEQQRQQMMEQRADGDVASGYHRRVSRVSVLHPSPQHATAQASRADSLAPCDELPPPSQANAPHDWDGHRRSTMSIDSEKESSRDRTSSREVEVSDADNSLLPAAKEEIILVHRIGHSIRFEVPEGEIFHPTVPYRSALDEKITHGLLRYVMH